jgi:hypothetical protein
VEPLHPAGSAILPPFSEPGRFSGTCPTPFAAGYCAAAAAPGNCCSTGNAAHTHSAAEVRCLGLINSLNKQPWITISCVRCSVMHQVTSNQPRPAAAAVACNTLTACRHQNPPQLETGRTAGRSAAPHHPLPWQVTGGAPCICDTADCALQGGTGHNATREGCLMAANVLRVRRAHGH